MHLFIFAIAAKGTQRYAIEGWGTNHLKKGNAPEACALLQFERLDAPSFIVVRLWYAEQSHENQLQHIFLGPSLWRLPVLTLCRFTLCVNSSPCLPAEAGWTESSYGRERLSVTLVRTQ